MKYRIFLIWLIFFFVNLVVVNISNADVPSYIEDVSPGIWDLPENEPWVPPRGAVVVCFESGKVRLELEFSDGNLNFFKNQKFSDDHKKPLGLEFDIIDNDGNTLSYSRLIPNSDNFPGSAVYEDVPFEDSKKHLALAISDFSEFEEGTIYVAEFNCPELQSKQSFNFQLQVQLVGNLKELKESYESKYNQYSYYYRAQVDLLFVLHPSNKAWHFFVLDNPNIRLYSKINRDFNVLKWEGMEENDKSIFSWTCGLSGTALNASSTLDEWYTTIDPSYNSFDPSDDPTVEGISWYWSDVYTPASDGSNESGDPDFVVREVFTSHHKKVLRPHEDTEIFTRIKNKGDDDTSKDIGLKYWRSDGEHIDSKDDRVNLGTDNIHGENLLPGESKWESKHTEAPSTPGVYNYTVEVDYDDEIDEIHNSNNKFEPPFVFEVKKPQLFLSSFSIVGETSLDPGNIFQVKAFTDNDGATPGPDVKLYYYLDGVKIGEDNMQDHNLEPEDPPKEESIYIVAPQTPGQHTVAVRVDPSDNIDEGNENDNYAEIIFSVNDLSIQVLRPPGPVLDFRIIE